jgi:hypothetical protein
MGEPDSWQPCRPGRAGLRVLAVVAIICAACTARAGEADVIAVKAGRAAGGSWSFSVTIRSNDRGWTYYCDRFEVRAPDGRSLGVRELLHPHQDEQPFTRDLDRVEIPRGVRSVLIRAHHSARGYDGKTLKVPLPEAR